MAKHIVCFSGGHSSAIVAIEVARKFGAENTVLLNHDICDRSEDADVKRFKHQVADYLGIGITYANHQQWQEKDQFDVCVDAKTWVNPSTRTILCTHRLKTEPFYRWLSENYAQGDVIYYGMDADETDRISRRVVILGEAGYKSDYPLATWIERTISQTIQVGINPPRQYSVFNHGNCMGCLKAGWQHWYVIYCTRPEIWAKGKASEEAIGYSIHREGYLEDKEALFEMMKDIGIPATEKIPSHQFWASVKRALRGSQMGMLFGLPDEERAIECMGDCGIPRHLELSDVRQHASA